jgi:hypothetical protein
MGWEPAKSAANEAFNTALALINTNIGEIGSFGDSMQGQLDGIISKLGSIELTTPAPPEKMEKGTELKATEIKNVLKVPAFDKPTPIELDALSTALNSLDTSIEGFNYGLGAAPVLSFPQAPSIQTQTAPERPAIDTTVDIADAPVLTLPEIGEMLPISIPEFEFQDLPPFNETPPSFNFPVPNPLINWTEPVYASQNLDEVQARVSEMLAGGTGLPKEIEQALFDRARQREDQGSAKAVSEAFDTFAAKNFSLPPGALVKQVNVINEQNRLKAAEINRDILVEASKFEIENLRVAVEKGIALEGLTMNLFENSAKRTFEVAKYYAESQIKIFDMHVQLFNAQNQGFQTLATVYKTKLEGILAKVQAFKAAVEAQQAIGQLNEQTVKVYSAKMQGLLSQVEIYKAVLSGAQVRSEVIKSQFEAYRTDVQAFAEKINAQKATVDIYKAQVEGESSKVAVYNSQVGAYAATVQAYSAKTEAKNKSIQAKIEVAKAQISEFETRAVAKKALLDGQVKIAEFQTNAFRSEVDAFRAEVEGAKANSDMAIKTADITLQANKFTTELSLKKYEVDLHQALETAKIAQAGLTAAGGYTSQLAAGAMSALHMSASVSGAGNMADTMNQSASQQHSWSESKGNNTNYNYNL